MGYWIVSIYLSNYLGKDQHTWWTLIYIKHIQLMYKFIFHEEQMKHVIRINKMVWIVFVNLSPSNICKKELFIQFLK